MVGLVAGGREAGAGRTRGVPRVVPRETVSRATVAPRTGAPRMQAPRAGAPRGLRVVARSRTGWARASRRTRRTRRLGDGPRARRRSSDARGPSSVVVVVAWRTARTRTRSAAPPTPPRTDPARDPAARTGYRSPGSTSPSRKRRASKCAGGVPRSQRRASFERNFAGDDQQLDVDPRAVQNDEARAGRGRPPRGFRRAPPRGFARGEGPEGGRGGRAPSREPRGRARAVPRRCV